MTAPMNAPPGQPFGWPAPPPAARQRHWRTGMVAAVAALGVLVGTGVGAGIYAALDSNSGPEAPVTMTMPTSSDPTDIGDSAAAQQKTCEILRSGYPAVSAAIDDRERFNTRSWTDSELLNSVNQLVEKMNRLASDLDSSLSHVVSTDFRTAVENYVAGLRAVSLSENAHASNVQLNGTGLFYNQVVDVVLPMCGIPS